MSRGSGRNLAAFGAALALSAAWMLLVRGLFFRGANTYEFAHYAEIGRGIARGEGFSTRVLYPSSLAYYAELGLARAERLPVNHRFPLPAYVSAGFQRVLGSNDLAAGLGPLLAYALWIALLFEVGRRFAGPWVGAGAAFLLAATPAGSKYFALFGLPDVYFGCIVLALHALLAESGPDMSPRRAAACGALAGLAWLARYNLLLWLPLYAGFFLLPPRETRKRSAACAAFFLGFLAIAFPALAYNVRHFGSLTTPDVIWNLTHGVVSREQTWLDFRTYSLADLYPYGWAPFAAKAWESFHSLLLDAPTLWQMQLLLPLAAVGLFAEASPTLRRLAVLTAAALALQIPVFSALRFDSWGLGVGYRYLFWAFPLVALGAAAAAKAVAKAGPHGKAAVAGGLALHLALLAPFYTRDLTAIHLSHPSGAPPPDWPELVLIRRLAADGSTVVTNLPAHVGWYADASAVALPNDPDDVARMSAARSLRYLFISFLNIGTLGDFPRWRKLLEPTPDGLRRYCEARGYRLVAMLPAGVIVDLAPGSVGRAR